MRPESRSKMSMNNDADKKISKRGSPSKIMARPREWSRQQLVERGFRTSKRIVARKCSPRVSEDKRMGHRRCCSPWNGSSDRIRSGEMDEQSGLQADVLPMIGSQMKKRVCSGPERQR